MARPETTQSGGGDTHGSDVSDFVHSLLGPGAAALLASDQHGIGQAVSAYIHDTLGHGQGGQGDATETAETETQQTDASHTLASSPEIQQLADADQFHFADTHTSHAEVDGLGSPTQSPEDALDHAGSHPAVDLSSLLLSSDIGHVQDTPASEHLADHAGWLVQP